MIEDKNKKPHVGWTPKMVARIPLPKNSDILNKLHNMVGGLYEPIFFSLLSAGNAGEYHTRVMELFADKPSAVNQLFSELDAMASPEESSYQENIERNAEEYIKEKYKFTDDDTKTVVDYYALISVAKSLAGLAAINTAYPDECDQEKEGDLKKILKNLLHEMSGVGDAQGTEIISGIVNMSKNATHDWLKNHGYEAPQTGAHR
jgi:hypothetical protein